MHLKSCQSLVHPAGVQASLQRSAVFVNQQGALVRTCSSNHGNMSSRLPLGIISTNTFRRSHADSGSRTTLQLLPPTSLCESSRTSLFRDDDALLDIWTVIKPGHVREKIAIFAADVRQANVASGLDQTVAVFPDHAPSPALSRAVKAKGNWEQTINAKRRRRSGGHQDAQQNRRSPPADAHKVPPQQPAGGRSLAETAEEKVSVGEMVAFLEQQVNQQQTGTKALLTIQKNSTIHVLSKPPESRDRSEVKGEEPVSVSNMVAKLESECLRRCSRGDLSRSNSLRRTVGRVLLAAVDQNSASPPALSSAPPTLHRKTLSCPETSVTAPVDPPPAKAPSESISKVEEPPPGLLFLSAPAAWLNPRAPDHVSEQKLSHPPRPPLLSRSQSERRAKPQQDGAVRLVRHVSASQDFLDKRQRLQRLLEPQSFLSVLPLHLLVQIFQLLPTQSLAALQCTCHYFKFVIETYSIRPADSLWVSDPRYRDDPCKQCKKRYGRGDVSLCRWHHKPYCQALPYGPGYWMCCHDVQRDAPGCNVGLHDNRWVPAFHSINVPIYRRSRKDN